ncbi:MAG: acyltransferase [Chloroflexi bacterium]|nr:acyltransferase [Chloroflexota bacterium]
MVAQEENAPPKRGNKLTRWLARTALALFGWKIIGELPDLPKFVIIGAPHTSNWDFVVAILLFIALGVRVSWMGKHTFVNGSLKRLWHWMGGVAINRQAAHGVVSQMVDEFNRQEKFVLGITPEGTRRKVAKWKMGFYYIAQKANVPIVPIVIDYEHKSLKLCPVFAPTGQVETDLAQIQALFANVRGKNPHQF